MILEAGHASSKHLLAVMLAVDSRPQSPCHPRKALSYTPDLAVRSGQDYPRSDSACTTHDFLVHGFGSCSTHCGGATAGGCVDVAHTSAHCEKHHPNITLPTLSQVPRHQNPPPTGSRHTPFLASQHILSGLSGRTAQHSTPQPQAWRVMAVTNGKQGHTHTRTHTHRNTRGVQRPGRRVNIQTKINPSSDESPNPIPSAVRPARAAGQPPAMARPAACCCCRQQRCCCCCSCCLAPTEALCQLHVLWHDGHPAGRQADRHRGTHTIQLLNTLNCAPRCNTISLQPGEPAQGYASSGDTRSCQHNPAHQH